ncbi:hypothetical protein WJX79_006210 [Trebouxia sp. C0005]
MQRDQSSESADLSGTTLNISGNATWESQFAAHSAFEYFKALSEACAFVAAKPNLQHRVVEAQHSSGQVASWSSCHLLRVNSHWDPQPRYGLGGDDTGKLVGGVRDAAIKLSSGKMDLHDVEGSSKPFPSGCGEDQTISSGMPWSLGACLKREPFHWPRYEANAADLATYDEPEASVEMCFAITQWLRERCGVVEDIPFVQRALIMAQDHIISSQARLHATPALQEIGLCTSEQVGHVTPTVAMVNMAPSKKRKGAPKGANGVQKTKAIGKKPRPTEALRTAFRKLIAGLEEVPAVLKEQNVNSTYGGAQIAPF